MRHLAQQPPAGTAKPRHLLTHNDLLPDATIFSPTFASRWSWMDPVQADDKRTENSVFPLIHLLAPCPDKQHVSLTLALPQPAGLFPHWSSPSICEWVQEEEATLHCAGYKALMVKGLDQEHMEFPDPSLLTYLPKEL